MRLILSLMKFTINEKSAIVFFFYMYHAYPELVIYYIHDKVRRNFPLVGNSLAPNKWINSYYSNPQLDLNKTP